MTNLELKNTLRNKITAPLSSILDIRNILIDYKKSGGMQESAHNVLNELAAEFSFDEKALDKTLEVLDIVTGWSTPSLRVWENELNFIQKSNLSDRLIIRSEKESDIENISQLVQLAFKAVKNSDHTEHIIIDRIRNSPNFINDLSIIAEYENEIIGHILLSKIYLKTSSGFLDKILALAPLSVHPLHQKNGVGKALIQYAHNKAREMGFKAVVVIGHRDYYPKLGYKNLSYFNVSMPFPVNIEYCFGLELSEQQYLGLGGELEYGEAFFV